MIINKDVLIIGAGPAGVSAAIYLARSKYSFCLVEKEMLGGKLNTITQIDNYPGLVTLSGIELIQKYSAQLAAHNIEVLKDVIKGIAKGGDLFKVVGEENTYIVKAIIIATGSSNKKSGVKGEKEFSGKGISYCAVCDGFFYRNKEVLVFANDAKGYKEALYLEKLASKVYLVNDNNKDDDEGDLVKLKSSNKVEFIYPYKIDEFDGDETGLNKVIISNLNNREEKREINVFGAFPFIGDIPGSYFLSSLNILNNSGYIVVNNNLETSVPGLYAAGDIIQKPLKQIVTASGDGATAATSAIRYLNTFK